MLTIKKTSDNLFQVVDVDTNEIHVEGTRYACILYVDFMCRPQGRTLKAS
jgi:hypothetical protein